MCSVVRWVIVQGVICQHQDVTLIFSDISPKVVVPYFAFIFSVDISKCRNETAEQKGFKTASKNCNMEQEKELQGSLVHFVFSPLNHCSIFDSRKSKELSFQLCTHTQHAALLPLFEIAICGSAVKICRVTAQRLLIQIIKCCCSKKIERKNSSEADSGVTSCILIWKPMQLLLIMWQTKRLYNHLLWGPLSSAGHVTHSFFALSVTPITWFLLMSHALNVFA